MSDGDSEKGITRKDFIKVSAGVVGGVALGASGLAAAEKSGVFRKIGRLLGIAGKKWEDRLNRLEPSTEAGKTTGQRMQDINTDRSPQPPTEEEIKIDTAEQVAQGGAHTTMEIPLPDNPASKVVTKSEDNPTQSNPGLK